jgi:hypothetical protein
MNRIPRSTLLQAAVGALLERVVGRLEPERAVAVVTECEACFTPDVCQLRGTCDHYRAELLRIAARALPQQVPNEHGHLLTTQALWGMYFEDSETPNVGVERMPDRADDTN